MTRCLAFTFNLLAAASLSVASPSAAPKSHGSAPSSGVLSLDVEADTTALHVLTGELPPAAAQPVLVYRRSEDSGASWTTPVRVDEGCAPAFSPHRGMDPQICGARNRVLAVWTTAGTDAWGSGPMATALSSDGGRTWKPGPNPADDGSTTGHSFIDVAADRGGVFHLTWLDSRDGKQGLRYACSADGGGTWSANITVKAVTCECCANRIAAGAGSELSILFRDHDPRDMHAVISKDGGRSWLPPVRVGAFDWKFEGCPHVGGGMTFSGQALHTIVWTAKGEQTGIYHVSAQQPGEAHRLAGANASHPDLAASADGMLAAVWDIHRESGTAIEGATSKDGGLTWSAPVRLSAATAIPTHPRVICAPAGFRVFWTESSQSEPSAWRSAELSQP